MIGYFIFFKQFIAKLSINAKDINLDIFLKENFYSTNYFISFDWFLELLPEFLLISFILYSLVSMFGDSVKPVYLHYRWLVFYGLILIILCFKLFFFSWTSTKIFLGFTWLSCLYILVSKTVIMCLTIVILWLSKNRLKNTFNLNCIFEFPLIVSFSVLFMFFLTSSYDFFGFYLSIEGLSLTLYVLSVMLQQSIVSIEATIKYFSLGAISTGILLLGVSIVFGLIGSLDFLETQIFLGSSKILLYFLEIKIGILFIIFGLLFKISVFPCHIWVADIYEGVWSPITAFFAITIKVCLVLFLIRLMFNVLFNVLFYFQFILSFSAIGSMLVGALMAIKQVRIKRFVAYTSINQMGFIMLGLASCNLTGLIATLFYISLYSVMSLIFFTIFLNSENIVTRRSMVFLSDLYSFSIFNNKHSKHLVLAIFSMAGLPPLGGFIGKLLIYFSVIEAKLDLLLMLSLLISMVSAFYYLSFVRYIFFEKQSNSKLYYYIKKNSFDNLLFLLSSFLLFFIVILPPLFPIISSIALSCSWPLVWY